MKAQVIQGNNVDVLRTFPDNHFDSIVTDPPYGIAFLGKDWDSRKATETTSKIAQLHNLPSGMAHTTLADDLEFQYWMRAVFAECLRVLKPGGHIIAFSAARTYHHMAMAAQTAGFEIRDQIMWIYSSGFPKSQDVGRSIQRSLGVEEYEEVIDTTKNAGFGMTDHARVRAGEDWSTTQKQVGKVKVTDPAAQQWEGWGTALKPGHEPCVLARKPLHKGNSIARNCQQWGVGALNIDATRCEDDRFPANVIGEIPEYQKYFYCPKVSRAERHIGFDDLPEPDPAGKYDRSQNPGNANERIESKLGNNHPTVKPIELMKYLIRLVTPPGGHVLDPFCGSGSTGCAAVELDREFTGCELDPAYVDIARKRIAAWYEHTHSTTFNEIFEIEP